MTTPPAEIQSNKPQVKEVDRLNEVIEQSDTTLMEYATVIETGDVVPDRMGIQTFTESTELHSATEVEDLSDQLKENLKALSEILLEPLKLTVFAQTDGVTLSEKEITISVDTEIDITEFSH